MKQQSSNTVSTNVNNHCVQSASPSKGAILKRARLFAGIVLMSGVLFTQVGCAGPKQEGTFIAIPTADQPLTPAMIDADPAALLPAGSLGVASLDIKLLAANTLAGDVLTMAERMVPFAAQIDFQLRRDVTKAFVAAYSFSGADVLGVLSGTFHPDKLEATAGKGISSPMGVIVVSTYAGRKLYTASNIGFTMLTNKTALVGTETAIRRALDRIQAGGVRRELPTWMGEWLFSDQYPIIAAGDLTKQSVGKTIGGLVPWVADMQYVRLRGKFNNDGALGVSGAITYPDEEKAKAAATGMQSLTSNVMLLAAIRIYGIEPLVKNLSAQASGSDVQITSVMNEASLRALTKMLADMLSSGAAGTTKTDSPPNPPNTLFPFAL